MFFFSTARHNSKDPHSKDHGHGNGNGKDRNDKENNNGDIDDEKHKVDEIR